MISTLLTSIKLRINNCSHRHHCESVIHRGSMIDIIIPTNFIIVLHCVLVHCESPSWFIESGSYHQNTRSFFTIVEINYHVVNKRTEIILPDQFCNLETCSVCSNNKYGMVGNNCPLLDTRNTKTFKELQEIDVVLGDLNLLGWVILKSDIKFNKVLNVPLAKLCAVDNNGYWERLVNTDEQRNILFPSNFKGNRFQKNYEIPFHLLESKFNFDYFVAMFYLKKNYKFSLFDFKLYRPNLITNDGYINHYQKVHRDFKINFPKIVVTFGSFSTEKNPSSSDKKEIS